MFFDTRRMRARAATLQQAMEARHSCREKTEAGRQRRAQSSDLVAYESTNREAGRFLVLSPLAWLSLWLVGPSWCRWLVVPSGRVPSSPLADHTRFLPSARGDNRLAHRPTRTRSVGRRVVPLSVPRGGWRTARSGLRRTPPAVCGKEANGGDGQSGSELAYLVSAMRHPPVSRRSWWCAVHPTRLRRLSAAQQPAAGGHQTPAAPATTSGRWADSCGLLWLTFESMSSRCACSTNRPASSRRTRSTVDPVPPVDSPASFHLAPPHL